MTPKYSHHFNLSSPRSTPKFELSMSKEFPLSLANNSVSTKNELYDFIFI